jgi:hypothetical protein
MLDPSPTTVVKALVVTSSETAYAIGYLHSLHYNWRMLDDEAKRDAIHSARESVEKMLVAILTAEQSIAPAVTSAPVVAVGDHDAERAHFESSNWLG